MKTYTWDELTNFALEYLSYLPVGDSCKNRNERQMEIVNLVIPNLRPFLFGVAHNLMNGGIRIKNAYGVLVRVSLRSNQVVSEKDLVQIGSLELNLNFHKYKPLFKFSTFVHLYAGRKMFREGNRQSVSIGLSYARTYRYNSLIKGAGSRDDALAVLIKEFEKDKKVIDPCHSAEFVYSTLLGLNRDLFGPVFEDGDSLESCVGLESNVEEKILVREVFDSLGMLDDRQRTIVEGILFDKKTLKELGEDFGVSKERIRQIKVRGGKRIKSYFGDSL